MLSASPKREKDEEKGLPNSSLERPLDRDQEKEDGEIFLLFYLCKSRVLTVISLLISSLGGSESGGNKYCEGGGGEGQLVQKRRKE